MNPDNMMVNQGLYVMMDMDGTLIESVMKDDPRYKSCKGDIIESDSGYSFKVNIRPGAPEMIQKLVKLYGHNYILWSAGKKNYVHAVMKYFNQKSGVEPIIIRTREDMIELLDEDSRRRKFKSNVTMGAELNNLLIVEDDPSLVDPSERERIFRVASWRFEMGDDYEMRRLINYLAHRKKTETMLCRIESNSNSGLRRARRGKIKIRSV